MATEISQERLQVLLEKYAQLKKDVLKVDEKYSLEYGEPKIDLPPSLNLEKLTFVPKTEEELEALANESIEAAFIAKQRQIDANFLNKQLNLNKRYSVLEEDRVQEQAKLLAEYNEYCDKLYKRLVNNGLLYSTANSKAVSQARKDYTDKSESADERYSQERLIIDAEVTGAQSAYEQALVSLRQEKQSKFNEVLTDLRQTEEKNRQNVEKYNNALQEKEIKYQASREKALEAAREAEYDRAYKMAKLLAEIGETGIKEKILTEKYHLCQSCFRTMRQSEAKVILNVDGFLQMNLEKYYSTFVDWIGYALIP